MKNTRSLSDRFNRGQQVAHTIDCRTVDQRVAVGAMPPRRVVARIQRIRRSTIAELASEWGVATTEVKADLTLAKAIYRLRIFAGADVVAHVQSGRLKTDPEVLLTMASLPLDAIKRAYQELLRSS
jgi:hypothetical protein